MSPGVAPVATGPVVIGSSGRGVQTRLSTLRGHFRGFNRGLLHMGFPLFLLALMPSAVPADADLLMLDELYRTMDRTVLETEIEHIQAAGGGLPEQARLKRLGIAWHNLAVLEVDDASVEADAWLTKAAEAAPEDYEVLAYLGSAQTLVARDSWNLVTKVSRVNKGAARMDEAVRKAPDNVAVRMVRANNSMALPKPSDNGVAYCLVLYTISVG